MCAQRLEVATVDLQFLDERLSRCYIRGMTELTHTSQRDSDDKRRVKPPKLRGTPAQRREAEDFMRGYQPEDEPSLVGQRDSGLRAKYEVHKADTGEPVEGCFVLRPDRDPAARVALLAYLMATDNYALRGDLHEWVEALIAGESSDRTAAVRIEVSESQVAAATEKAVRARRAAEEAEQALGWATDALERARALGGAA